MKIIATNRKVRFNYELIKFYEAGIELLGSEVKSLRESNISLQDSYVIIREKQVYVINLHISNYKHTAIFQPSVDRPRRLLLHKSEIEKISKEMQLQKLQLIPTKIYFNSKSLVKLEIVLAKPKKLYDKRQVIKERDVSRKIKKIF